MSGNRTIVTRLRAEMGQFKRAWNEAGKAVEDTEKKIVRSSTFLGNLASDVDNNARAWDVAGKSILASGLVMAAGIGFSIKAAIDWEAAWTGVLKTVDGTPKQLAELESGLRSLATQLPASASEIAGVAEAAGALGVAREDVLSFTKTMIDLGETTNLTADEAATAIAQIQNVMKTAPEDIDNFGSALVSLGNNGASTEKQILDMAQRIAGAGAIIGLTEADVLGISNALASVGIEAEAGGSSVSRILIDISKAVSTNSTDLAKWAEVSDLSVEKFSEKWKTSPAEGFKAFTEGLARVRAEGGDVFTMLEELGQSDVRTTQALLGMATSGDMLAKSLRGGAAAWEANTALAAEAEKRYGTTAAQIEIAKNKVNESLISIGEGMLPAVNTVVGGFSEILDMFNYLPGPLKTATGVVGGFGAAFLTAGGLAVLAVPKILQFTDAVRAMEAGPIKAASSRLIGFGKFLMGPWGLALAAAAIPLALWAKKNADAARAQAELKANAASFTATLDKQTGAITAATKQQVADNLAQEGALAFADKYKISQGLVVEAALGSKDAVAELANEIGRKDVDLWDNKDILAKIFAASEAASKGKKDWKATSESLKQLQAEQVKTGLSSRALSDVLNTLSPDAEEAQKKLDALKDSTRAAALSFVDFSKNLDKDGLSFANWIKGLDEMGQAQAKWQDNMILAKTMGATEEAIAKFQELGPAGAKMLDEMVNGGKKSVDKLNEIFDGGIPAAEDFSRVMNEISPDILVKFDVKGDKNAIAKVAALAHEQGIIKPDIETILRANDWATADIKAVLARMDELDAKEAKPKVDVTGAPKALGLIDSVYRSLGLLTDKSVTITTTRKTIKESYTKGSGKSHDSLEDMLSPYTGMMVPEGYVSGGKVPGTAPSDPTVDNVLAMGATSGRLLKVRSGEWIINEQQSKKNDPWLAAINAGLNIDDLITGYASGGRASALDVKNQQRTVRDLERSLREREKYGKKPKKGRDTRRTRNVLRGLDRQIAQLELAEAKQELSDLRSGRANRTEAAAQRRDDAISTRDSVASGLAGGFGLAQFSGKNAFGQSTFSSGKDIAAGAKAYAAKLRAFAAKIEKARKLGIPSTMLQEIGGLGVEEGTLALDALLSASSSDIATIKTAYRDIDTYAKSAGEVIAKALDLSTAGKDSAGGYAKGFINGLNGYADAMGKAANDAAKGKKSKSTSKGKATTASASFVQPPRQAFAAQSINNFPAPTTATIASSDMAAFATSVATAIASNPVALTALFKIGGRDAVALTDLSDQTKAKQS